MTASCYQERLAIIAHELWCDRQRAQGWPYADRYDPARRTHDALVPWDRLGEPDRRAARMGVRLEGVEDLLAESIEYTRGPARVFTPEEMRVGQRVAYVEGIRAAEPGRDILNERGRVVSWEVDPCTGGLAFLRVQWDDGTLAEHYPSERELRRVDEMN